MSPLPIFGKAANPMLAQMGQGGQAEQPWVFISELRSDFTVREVPMTSAKIDDDIKVLVVIDPKEITDQAQFAIDQFIMRGGKLIAYLDAFHRGQPQPKHDGPDARRRFLARQIAQGLGRSI